MDNCHVHIMLFSELDDFVCKKAKPGDIAMSRDPLTKYLYMYHCTTENIGKDANPSWVRVDEKALWENYFKNMTMEEKVNFLIENYIHSVIYENI